MTTTRTETDDVQPIVDKAGDSHSKGVTENDVPPPPAEIKSEVEPNGADATPVTPPKDDAASPADGQAEADAAAKADVVA